jgi:hypothetical protein
MPGFGKRYGPAVATPEGTIADLKERIARHNALYAEHIGELVDCLFEKYMAHPDKQSEKLLIMHLGSEFFTRFEAAQPAQRTGETAELCRWCNAPETAHTPTMRHKFTVASRR